MELMLRTEGLCSLGQICWSVHVHTYGEGHKYAFVTHI